jgi:hypothetical protein
MSTTTNPTPNPAPSGRPYRPRSISGPLVLISLGVLFLAYNVGWLPGRTLAHWFSQWWPALLILWGVVKVLEYTVARSKGEPAPRGIGAGGIVFLVFFILFGLSATGLSHVPWDNLRNDWNIDDGNDWTFFGNRYDFTENVAQPLADAAQIKVTDGWGDITVSPSADAQAHLFVHKRLQGDSQDEGNRLNDSTHPKFVQQGKVWILDLASGNFVHGRFNLDLQVPANVALSVTTHRGDISVDQRTGDVELSTDRGALTAKNVKGNVTLRLHRGDATVDEVTGNVQIDGSGGDTTVSNVSGTLTVNGEYGGDSRFSKIGGQVRFKSNRTDLQFAKLDGEFNMDRSDLRADSVTGPFRLETKYKEIHLEGVTGEVHIDDTNSAIEVETKAPLGAIDINSTHGGIEVSVPANAGMQVDAESKNGEINSDFTLNVDNQHRDATAHGTIGKGGPLMRLRLDRGTIQIKKHD